MRARQPIFCLNALIKRLPDAGHEIAQFSRSGLRRCLFQQLNQTTADHYGIRHRRHGAGGFPVANPESDTDRHGHAFTYFGDHRRDTVDIEITRARDTFQRHIVDVAARYLADRSGVEVGANRKIGSIWYARIFSANSMTSSGG